MTDRLLTGADVWTEISRLSVRSNRGAARIAVAYATNADLLSVRPGDVIVVDASRYCVETGATDPSVLRLWVQAGADVYSFPNLHAKAFAFGTTTVVGSANASNRSSTLLVEAAFRSSDVRVSREVAEFVHWLTERREATQLRSKQLEALAKVFGKRRGNPPPGGDYPIPGPINSGDRVWLLGGITLGDWSEPAKASWEAHRGGWRRVVGAASHATVEATEWAEPLEAVRVRAGDVVVFAGSDAADLVWPPGRVVEVLGIARNRRVLVVLASDPDLEPTSWHELRASARLGGVMLRKDPSAYRQLMRSGEQRAAICSGWPSVQVEA